MNSNDQSFYHTSSMMDSPQRPSNHNSFQQEHSQQHELGQGGGGDQVQFSWYDPSHPTPESQQLNSTNFSQKETPPLHCQSFSQYLTSPRLHDGDISPSTSGQTTPHNHSHLLYTSFSTPSSPSYSSPSSSSPSSPFNYQNSQAAIGLGNMSQLLNITNSHIKRLEMNYNRINSMMSQLETNLNDFISVQNAKDRVNMANILQNIENQVEYSHTSGITMGDDMSGNGRGSSSTDQYHISQNAIFSHSDYLLGQKQARTFQSNTISDRVRNDNLKMEFIIDMQKQLSELTAQRLEIQKQQIQAQKVRDEQIIQEQQYKEQLRLENEQHRVNELYKQQQLQQDAIQKQQQQLQQQQLQQQQLQAQQQQQQQQQQLQLQQPSQLGTTAISKPTGSRGGTTSSSTNTTTTSGDPASKISPTQQLCAQTQNFGFDFKLVHFYIYHYLFTNLCFLHLKSGNGNSPDKITNTEKELVYIASLWSRQSLHTIDFPSHVYYQTKADQAGKQGAFDIERIEEMGKKSTVEKIRITGERAFLTIIPANGDDVLIENVMKINNIYPNLYNIFQFLSEYNHNNSISSASLSTISPSLSSSFTQKLTSIQEKQENDKILGQFMLNVLDQNTIDLISNLQSIIDFKSILNTINSTLTPSAGKLSKTYLSIGQTIGRFGGILQCQATNQSPSQLSLKFYHPVISMLVITRLYHELLESTQDAYLLGMTLSLLAQVTPFFHYLTIGSLLNSHRHCRIDTPQSSSLTPQPISHPQYRSKTAHCTSPSCVGFIQAYKGPRIKYMNSRIGLLMAYLQSAPKNVDLQITPNIFQQDLGVFRRKVDHPMTTMEDLRGILDVLHLDFSVFSQQFGTFITVQVKKPTTTTTTTAQQQPPPQFPQLHPLARDTTWESCNCCGYNSINPSNLYSDEYMKLSTQQQRTKFSPYHDPHWAQTNIVNKLQSSKLLNSGAGVILSTQTTPIIQNQPHICPFPTLFPFFSFSYQNPNLNPQYCQQYLTQQYQNVMHKQFPIELLATTAPNSAIPQTIPTENINPKHVIIMGKKPRLEFLWGWYARMINVVLQGTGTAGTLSSSTFLQQSASTLNQKNNISPAFIHFLLITLNMSGAQFRFTYNHLGHDILELIYNEILVKKRDLLTTFYPPSSTNTNNSKVSINSTEYTLLMTNFDQYHMGATEQDGQGGLRRVTEPNHTYPFDKDTKVIQGQQDSSTEFQSLDAGGDRQE